MPTDEELKTEGSDAEGSDAESSDAESSLAAGESPAPKSPSSGAWRGRDIPGMFEGPVLPLVVRMSLPILAGMAFQIVYKLTDAFWISRIDPTDPSYFGGIGMVFPLMFLGMAIGNGLMVGTSAMVARAIGRGDKSTLSSAVESGLAISLILGLVFFVLGNLFSESLVNMLGAEGDFFTHAHDYFRVMLLGLAIVLVTNTLFGVLQGEGLMKQVMKAMIIGTVANVILDPVFIFVLDLRVRGAALATVCAQLLSMLVVLRVFLQKKNRIPVEWKLNRIRLSIIGEIAAIGMPQTVSQMILSFSFVFLNRIVIELNPLYMTAFALVGTFDQAIFMPLFALSAALVTIAGQNMGRGNYRRVRRVWYVSVGTGGVVVFVVATIIIVLAPFIFPIFSDLDDVVRYAVRQARIMEYSFILAVAGMLGRSIFQAIGAPLKALIVVLFRLVILVVPAVLLYVYVFGWGIYGVFGGQITGNLITAAISMIWIERLLQRQIKNGGSL